MKRFETILLGDNAFYGIDHLSHSRARERTTIQRLENAVEVIKCAYDAGIDGLMVATRPKLKEIVQQLETSGDLVNNLDFYPVMPYARGLQMKLSEKGILNLIKEMSAGGIKEEIRIIAKGGLGLIKKDFDSLFRVFIDTEIIKLKVIQPKIIYLHPVIVDLVLALNLKHVFKIFQEHLLKKYNIKAGLCTKNFKVLLEKLDEWDMEFASIMTSFNPVGFLMNPSKEECEHALSNYRGHVLVMNIFGGGFVNLDEVIEYLKSQPKIKNVVVGVSSVSHAKETFSRLVEMEE